MDIKVHIIAREGSKRVVRKNLRLLNGKPMVSYAIEAALASKILKPENIYLNTECPQIAEIGKEYGISIYDRNPELADDDIVLDELTYDFAKNVPSEVVGMINPVCPLTTGEDIDRGINTFLDNNNDSLVAVREEQLQAFLNDSPINFQPNKKIDKTQNLSPAQIVTWNFCFWKAESFINNFEKNGFGVFHGNLGLCPVDKLHGVKISIESDFQIAEALLRMRDNEVSEKESYYK
jgi:CMP-N,N'-diacetyllegionaminic acid synthase